MKKRMLSLSAILGMSFLLLTGFDRAVTPERILEDSAAAIQNISSLDFNTNFDVVLNIEMITGSGEDSISTNIGTGISGNMAFQASEDQGFGMQMDLNISAMGSSQTNSMQMYSVPNGDTYDLYSYDSDSNIWTYEESSAPEMQDSLDMIMGSFTSASDVQGDSSSSFDMSAFDFTLSDQPVTVNGVSCYELKSTIDSSSFAEDEAALIDLLQQSGIAEDQQMLLYYVLNGLYADLSYYVAVDTNLPVQMTIDLSQSDLSAYAQLMEESLAQETSSSSDTVATSFQVSMDPCLITMDFEANNTPTIEVPAEALAAKEAAQTPSPASSQN